MNPSKKLFKEAINNCEDIAEKYGFKVISVDYIDDNHTDCIWYGGTVLHLSSNKMDIFLNAYGDVAAELALPNGKYAYMKDKNNSGAFYDEMSPYIKSDKDYIKKLNNNSLVLDNNNWLELTVYDKTKEEWVDDDAGLLDETSILYELNNIEESIKWALEL